MTPTVYEVLHENYFYKKKSGYFIECGAGGSGDSCRLFEDAGWKGVYIEPSPTMFKQLDRENKYNIGLGKEDNKLQIFTDIISAPGGGWDNGSFKHTESHRKILDGYDCIFQQTMVQVITYKSLMKRLGIKKIDLMVLDVEGYEIEVMEGMKGARLPDVLCVEYPIVGFDVIKLCACEYLGYYFDFISNNNAYFSIQEREQEWFGETKRIKDIG